jgi:hypothetical protein
MSLLHYINQKINQTSFSKVSRRTITAISCSFVAIATITWQAESHAQSSLQVRTNQWLRVEQISGNVRYRNRAARVGDRLQAVNDEISTGNNSSAVLSVDTAVGTIYVAPNSTIRINSFRIAPDNGRITNLFVPRGKARLQIRKFTNRGSQLNIQTPAGISGVRGTDFAVFAQPNGRTVLTTYQGSVASTAQNRTVIVKGGSENFMIAGQPPSAPMPIKNDPSLRYVIDRRIVNNQRAIFFMGYTNPVNIVKVNGIEQKIDRNGQFTLELPATSTLTLNVTVETPQGKVNPYAIPIL